MFSVRKQPAGNVKCIALVRVYMSGYVIQDLSSLSLYCRDFSFHSASFMKSLMLRDNRDGMQSGTG